MLFKGAIYHVTTRGIERRRLFDDDPDGAAVSQQIQRLRQRMVEDAELGGGGTTEQQTGKARKISAKG